MNNNSSLVPFGKYKGQPLEALAADKEYLEWLTAQPWVQQRYPSLHTLIINNFGEPDETPEHNRLQAQFLNDAFCLKVFRLLRPDSNSYVTRKAQDKIDGSLRTAEAAWERDIKDFRSKVEELEKFEACTWDDRQQAYTEGLTTWTGYGGVSNGWDEAERRFNDKVEALKSEVLAAQAEQKAFVNAFENAPKTPDLCWEVDATFEERGVDVTLTVTVGCGYTAFETPYRLRFVEDSWFDAYETTLRIEIKPLLGDDYPAVLRQMLASNSNVLVVDQFISQAISLDQLKDFFSRAGCKVISLQEIDEASVQ